MDSAPAMGSAGWFLTRLAVVLAAWVALAAAACCLRLTVSAAVVTFSCAFFRYAATSLRSLSRSVVSRYPAISQRVHDQGGGLLALRSKLLADLANPLGGRGDALSGSGRTGLCLGFDAAAGLRLQLLRLPTELGFQPLDVTADIGVGLAEIPAEPLDRLGDPVGHLALPVLLLLTHLFTCLPHCLSHGARLLTGGLRRKAQSLVQSLHHQVFQL